MNVQGIWAGEYYAFSEYKGRSFPMRASKGKCLRVEKVKPVYGERAKAFAIFEVIQEDTGERIVQRYDNGVPVYEKRVRARDVVDEWDSYVNERSGILRERQESERIAAEQRQRMQQEMEEQRQERLARMQTIENQEREKRERFIEVFTRRTGLPTEALISVTPTSVTLDRTMLDFWLSAPANG